MLIRKVMWAGRNRDAIGKPNATAHAPNSSPSPKNRTGLGFVPSKARKPGTGPGFVFSKARKPGTGPGFGKNSHKALYFRASPENPGPGFPSGVNFTVHCGKLVVDAALPINTRALMCCWALRIVAVACNRNRKQEKQRLGNITPVILSSLCNVHIGAGSWSELRQETTTTAGAVVEVAAARSNEHRGVHCSCSGTG